MLDKDYYTYMLAYPDGTPFYIGKGRGNRIYQHEEEARNGGQLERHIIMAIRDIANSRCFLTLVEAY